MNDTQDHSDIFRPGYGESPANGADRQAVRPPAPEKPRSSFNMVGEMGPLFAALADAQGEFPEIVKNESADAGKYAYNYADLSTIIKACKGPLKTHGLAVIHPPSGRRDQMTMRALLTHKSGAYIECIVELRPKDDSIQALGSEMTYMRRYTYMALTGVFPAEEDDDGAAADGKQQSHGPRANTRPTPPPVQQAKRDVQTAGAQSTYTRAAQAEAAKPKAEPKPAPLPEPEAIVIGPHGEVLETAPVKTKGAPPQPTERTVELDPVIAESCRRQMLQSIAGMWGKSGVRDKKAADAFIAEVVGSVVDLKNAPFEQVEKIELALRAKIGS